MTVGIVGLGLIGGSMAKSIKARTAHTVFGCDLDQETMMMARMCGAIDAPLTAENLKDCDLVLVAIRPAAAVKWVKEHAEGIRRDAILVDLCGVKRAVVRELAPVAEQYGFAYIGGHPMAGSERIGFANSKAGLLENAYYILAPAPQVPAAKIAEFQGLVTSMGAIPLQVESQKHDYVTAAVSHLPHIVAAALVHLVQDHDDAQGLMKSIAAGGFKDITRIASSSPVMWEQICMTNTVNISRLLQDYIDALGVVQKELQEHDSASLYTFFDGARAYRDSFIDAGSGPIKKDYSIRLDIPDEAGSIAAVSTLLALNNISIKNIGIVHNREAQEGVLRIEFYEEDSITKAIQLLNRRGYVTHI